MFIVVFIWSARDGADASMETVVTLSKRAIISVTAKTPDLFMSLTSNV